MTDVTFEIKNTSSADPLITGDGKAPHLSDLMTSTYLPDQFKDIHELKIMKKRLEQYGDDEILFDRLLLWACIILCE